MHTYLYFCALGVFVVVEDGIEAETTQCNGCNWYKCMHVCNCVYLFCWMKYVLALAMIHIYLEHLLLLGPRRQLPLDELLQNEL